MSITFRSRESLHLRAPNLQRLTLRTPAELTTQNIGLTGHWTGAGGTLYHVDPVTRLQQIQAYHMDTLHYGDIAYEGAFDSDGVLYGLRDNRFVGAHAASTNNVANRLTDGIVWLEDARGWTQAAARAWDDWCNIWTLAHRKRPNEFAHEWWVHLGGTPTACPGPSFRAQIAHEGGHA